MEPVIYCTDKLNDADVVKELGSLAVVVPVNFGDYLIFGIAENGKEDNQVRVLTERKKIHDLVSSIITGRYLSQVQAAHDAGYEIFVLIYEVEDMRPSPIDGNIEVKVWERVYNQSSKKTQLKHVWKPLSPQNISYSRFDQYLTELAFDAKIIVKRSRDYKETAAIIKAIWLNFQEPRRKHSSLQTIYTSSPPTALLHKPSLLRRMSKELKGIGWERSLEVEHHFESVRAMVNADVKEWESIPNIGRITAQKAVASLNGIKEWKE